MKQVGFKHAYMIWFFAFSAFCFHHKGLFKYHVFKFVWQFHFLNILNAFNNYQVCTYMYLAKHWSFAKLSSIQTWLIRYSLCVLNLLSKNFEQNTRSTCFLFHFINYVGELWTYLHCYHINGNNVNHDQMFL